MKVIDQDSFDANEGFNSSRCNLHRHVASPSRRVAVFVHGLGGSGYGTWGDFPRLMFDRESVDVAIFDFPTFHRRLAHRGVSSEAMRDQVRQALEQLAIDYESVLAIAHSLGGIVAEEAAALYLQAELALNQRLTPLSALILLGSPRAGTGWVPNWAPAPIDELKSLKRAVETHRRRDSFMTDFVQRHCVADVRVGQVLCPVYAATATEDRWVSEFSAMFGVPTRQRQVLATSHKELVKPTEDDCEVVDWVVRVASDVADVREQWTREEGLRVSSLSGHPPEKSPTVVTEFWGDADSTEWEEAYNDVRREVSTPELAAVDRRGGDPDSRVDLLISVSNASRVIAQPEHTRTTVTAAHARRADHGGLSVGLAPVGDDAPAAGIVINGYLADLSPLPSIYVNPAINTAALRAVMTRWLLLVMERDPRSVAARNGEVQSGLGRQAGPFGSLG
ncbi:MAG TPA: alpha/beta hydrolase [Mycobacteriales bacterium]|nr:alpha/beta hydrolase [Mycobacteriales bacterium]